LLVYFKRNKNIDYNEILDDFEIINLLLDMQLLNLKMKIYIDKSYFEKVYILKLLLKESYIIVK